MIYSIIRKPGPIQLPTGNSGTGTGSGNTGTCTTYPCPDVLVPGYNNNGNDGGTALPVPGAPVLPAADTTVGTGMDMEKKTSMLSELSGLFLPGMVLAVLIFILYSASSQK